MILEVSVFCVCWRSKGNSLIDVYYDFFIRPTFNKARWCVTIVNMSTISRMVSPICFWPNMKSRFILPNPPLLSLVFPSYHYYSFFYSIYSLVIYHSHSVFFFLSCYIFFPLLYLILHESLIIKALFLFPLLVFFFTDIIGTIYLSCSKGVNSLFAQLLSVTASVLFSAFNRLCICCVLIHGMM